MYSYGEATYGEYQIWLLLITNLVSPASKNGQMYFTYDYKVGNQNLSLYWNPFNEDAQVCFLDKRYRDNQGNRHTPCQDVIVPAISIMRITNKHIMSD